MTKVFVIVTTLCVFIAFLRFCGADDGTGNCFAKCSVDSDCGTTASPGCTSCVNGACSCGEGLEPCAAQVRTGGSFGYTPYDCINSTTHSCCGPTGDQSVDYIRSPYVGNNICPKGHQCCIGRMNWYCYDPATHVCCDDQNMRSSICPAGSACIHQDWYCDGAYCVGPPDSFCVCSYASYTVIRVCNTSSECYCDQYITGNEAREPKGKRPESGCGIIWEPPEAYGKNECMETPNTQCNCPFGTNCVKNSAGVVVNCTDIDECASGEVICPANHKCVNKYAGYLCKKLDPCEWSPSVCAAGYLCFSKIDVRNSESFYEEPVGYFCQEYDECKLNGTICPPDHDCINTEGSYICKPALCPAGSSKYPAFDKKCRDCYWNSSAPLPITSLSPLFGGHPNVAFGKRVSQTDTYLGFVARYAVDGSISTFQQCQRQTAYYESSDMGDTNTTNMHKSWVLNLGVEHVITGINLVPRQDCCSTQFKDYTIIIRNLKGERTARLLAGSQTYSNFAHVFTTSVTGITVEVQKSLRFGEDYGTQGAYMHMAEFEVYGYVLGSGPSALRACINSNNKNITDACAPGYGRIKGQGSCVEIDECAIPSLNDCEPDRCVNTNGSYVCSCQNGNQGPTCSDDVNECESPTACQTGRKCVNNVGSFDCNERRYFVRSMQTGFVATAGPNPGDNVIVAVQKSSGFDDQLWSFVPGEGGFLRNVLTGRVMDIKSGATSAGNNVITWTKKIGYSLNQQWGYNATSFVFKSKATNLVLDVKHSSTSPNMPIIVYTPKSQSANQNQRFQLVEYVYIP